MASLGRREFIGGAAVCAASKGAAWGADAEIEQKTITYAVRDGRPLQLDLFLPPGRKGRAPVIIFLHGGGWSGGGRTTGPDFKRFFARDGFAMVAIEYRLTPAIVFPANLEDVKTCIRWIRAHADELGLDPRRIGLWGTSAGGYLAAMAGLTPRGVFEGPDNLDRSSEVACVLDAYGPTLFTEMDRQTAAEAPTLQAIAEPLRPRAPATVQGAQPAGPPAAPRLHDAPDSAESRLMGAPLQTIADKVRAASPLSFVTAKAPPFLIIHGLADSSVPHGQSVILYEALARAENEVTLRLVDGLPHTFYNRTNLDELAGPFRMDVRNHPRGGAERASVETGKVFDVAREFFRRHLV